jgi:xanthine dehydrogenase/oxidase
MYGLWLNNHAPSVTDIEDHFDGNLCRCTGYRPILQAFQPFASDHKELNAKSLVLPDTPCQKRRRTEEEAMHTTGCCKHAVPSSVGRASVDFGEDIQHRLDELSKELSKPQGIFVPGRHLGQGCEWFQPTNLKDVLSIMSVKSTVRLQVGNTERRVEKFFKWNHTYPMTLVSLSQVEELQGVEFSSDRVRLGASTPLQFIYTEFEDRIASLGAGSPQTRVLQAYCAIIRWFAGHQIRNVACLGGNIATASPISDLNPCHISAGVCLDVACTGPRGEVTIRHINMGSLETPFFNGYRKTLLGPQDVIVALNLPLTRPDGSEFFEAYKQARRRDDDLAIVNAAMRVRFDGEQVADACFSFGGMAPFTKACRSLSSWWRGREWTYDNFSQSLDLLAKDLPLPDGSPGGMCEYRRLLARSFYFKFWASVGHARGKMSPPVPLTDREMGGVLSHNTSANYCKPPLRGLQHFARDQITLLQPTSSPDKHMAGDMQVAGRARYTDDFPQTMDEVFMDFVCSTKAHARIVRIDVSPAEKVDGFVDMITAADIKGEKMLGPIAHDEEAIASEEVHHVGAIIAAVCATSRYAARVAAKAVIVEYEELPAIVSLEEAIEKKSFLPLLFQDPGDVEAQVHMIDSTTTSAASMDELMGACMVDPEVAVVEGEIFMGGQEHFYLETNATRVVPLENDEYHITTSSQNPHETQLLCAKALSVPISKVTCQVKRLGGGFGGKESRCCLLSIPAAVAAQKLQRPVRFQLDRDVDQVLSGQRHSFIGRYKLAIRRNTLKLFAADVDLYSNGGCSLDLSQPVLNRAMLHCTNACHVPNVRVRGHICKTNIPSNTAFRGFGCPQGMFLAETMFEHAARELGVAREALLCNNLYSTNGKTFFNHSLTKGLTPGEVPLQRMWNHLVNQCDFEDRRSAADVFNSVNRYKKRGLAITPTTFGISFTATHLNQAGSLVHVQKDGSVLVAHGGVEMGQGLHTKLARVAANIFNIPIEAVYIKETCTDTVANTTATAASSGTDLNGAAVANACEELRDRLKPFVDATIHNDTRSDRRQEALGKAANLAFLNRVNLTAQGYHRTPIKGCNWKQRGVNQFDGDPFWYYTYGVACSEVEVDCLTGDVTMLRTDIVHDVGRSVNAAIDIGQVEGAFAQGVGLYMMEEVVFDKSGRLCSKGPGMYKIPGFGDVPLDFRVRLLEQHAGPAVMGSKAVGEPPLFLGSSVFYATKEAIYAARRDFHAEASSTGDHSSRALNGVAAVDTHFRLDPPATCEKIRMACLDFMNPSGKRSEWHARA